MYETERRFVEQFEARIRDDDRVLAAYVGNVEPSEYGDFYADVLLIVACRREAFDELVRELPFWVGGGDLPPAGPREHSLGGSKWVTRDGLCVDAYLFKGELGRWSKPVTRVLKETAGFFTAGGAGQPPAKGGERRRPAEAEYSCVKFWEGVAVMPRTLRRGDLILVHLQTLVLLRRLIDVLTLRAEPPPRLASAIGLRVDDLRLLEADHRLLESAVVTPGGGAAAAGRLTREGVARQFMRLAAIMAEHGPAVCRQLGAEYPLALQQAVLGRVRRELDELSMSPEP